MDMSPDVPAVPKDTQRASRPDIAQDGDDATVVQLTIAAQHVFRRLQPTAITVQNAETFVADNIRQ